MSATDTHTHTHTDGVSNRSAKPNKRFANHKGVDTRNPWHNPAAALLRHSSSSVAGSLSSQETPLQAGSAAQESAASGAFNTTHAGTKGLVWASSEKHCSIMSAHEYKVHKMHTCSCARSSCPVTGAEVSKSLGDQIVTWPPIAQQIR